MIVTHCDKCKKELFYQETLESDSRSEKDFYTIMARVEKNTFGAEKIMQVCKECYKGLLKHIYGESGAYYKAQLVED